MIHLTSGPALVVEIGFAVFAFIDVLLSPEAAARWIPRWGWILAVLIFPVCGSIGWIVAGRSWRLDVRGQEGLGGTPAPTQAESTPRSTPMHSPMHSPGVPRHLPTSRSGGAPLSVDLVTELAALNEEHERTLRLWESDLRRREAALRSGGDVGSTAA
jgi:hypothetical protein